jgi:hypothetical protein
MFAAEKSNDANNLTKESAVRCISETQVSQIGIYEGWNFNFGNTMLDWIQALLE